MRLALALSVSTAHANTPHCDLDLLYHDGSANGLDTRSSFGSLPLLAPAYTRLAPPRART